MDNQGMPLLVSVPHAGLTVPTEAEPYCALTPTEIAEDGDEQAREIYAPLKELVRSFHTSEVARAIVDLNRARGDRRKDGVVKTHTCWDVPVYRSTPPEPLLEVLLERYHAPFHRALGKDVGSGVFPLAIDCHTMAATGPPVGPDPGVERPLVCVGTGQGATCPQPWVDIIVDCLCDAFGEKVYVDRPFSGGYIVKHYGTRMPWVLLELSRTDRMSVEDKSQAVVQAFTQIARRITV